MISLTHNQEQFIYWISERWAVKERKEAGAPKPWSDNKVFQETYFCNVRREDDRVTKWIREAWEEDTTYLPDLHFPPEFNMMMARMVNKPSSLAELDWPWSIQPYWDLWTRVMAQKGAWGSAYIVSTNGRAMPKHEYIMSILKQAQEPLEQVGQANTLAQAHKRLMGIQGLGSFMSAQIVADLKNTPNHILSRAPDWWTWASHGPGSLRGLEWLQESRVTPSQFREALGRARLLVDDHLDYETIPVFCNQDLQNCLCEYDKFMRVTNGTGRSKRGYNGKIS